MERVEMHLHTLHSRDCAMRARTIIAACVRRGVTTLFVTDHNEIDGGRMVQREAPFRVILGEEITTSEGELLGYFLKDRVPPGLTPEQTIAAIKQQGGLVGVPHPFDRLRSSRLSHSALERIKSGLDMLEVFNARNVFPSDDAAAFAYAERHRLRKTCGSDAHSGWEVGRSTVEMDDFATPAAFLANLEYANLSTRRSPLWVHGITKCNKFRSRLGIKPRPSA